jgi:hypothetical protein
MAAPPQASRRFGVKIRTRQVHAGCDEGVTKVLSAKLNSRGQFLHDLVREAVGAGEHGKLIAAEGPAAEHIDEAELRFHGQPAIASNSTAAPSGSAATPIAVRAG